MADGAIQLDPRLLTGLVGLVGVVVGGIATGLREKGKERRHRRQRVQDMQRALFAEIRAYVAVLERDDPASYGAAMETRIVNEAGFWPVIPQEHNSTIFEAVVQDIHVLPRQVIDPVALYYSQLVAIRLMIEDLRGVDLGAIGSKRAAAMYADYIALKVEALDLGRDAMLMMGGYFDGGASRLAELEQRRLREEDERLRQSIPTLKAEIAAARQRLNIPGGDRSGQ